MGLSKDIRRNLLPLNIALTIAIGVLIYGLIDLDCEGINEGVGIMLIIMVIVLLWMNYILLSRLKEK